MLFITVAWALHLPAKDSQANGRIFNGVNAAEGQFPYVVFLETGNLFSCGGALIGREWVVTAAHCVFGEQSVTVYLGMTYMKTAGVTHSINSDSFVIYAGYNNHTLANDIALINIPTTNFSKTIAAVPLPALNPSRISYTHMYTIFSGWGMNGDKGGPAKRLQWAILPIISNEECNATYEVITENQLCVSTTVGSSPCLGDSGSPLVTVDKYTLIGISSTGSTMSCEDDSPVVFTRITNYLHWIKDVTGIWYYSNV